MIRFLHYMFLSAKKLGLGTGFRLKARGMRFRCYASIKCIKVNEYKNAMLQYWNSFRKGCLNNWQTVKFSRRRNLLVRVWIHMAGYYAHNQTGYAYKKHTGLLRHAWFKYDDMMRCRVHSWEQNLVQNNFWQKTSSWDRKDRRKLDCNLETQFL